MRMKSKETRTRKEKGIFESNERNTASCCCSDADCKGQLKSIIFKGSYQYQCEFHYGKSLLVTSPTIYDIDYYVIVKTDFKSFNELKEYKLSFHGFSIVEIDGRIAFATAIKNFNILTRLMTQFYNHTTSVYVQACTPSLNRLIEIIPNEADSDISNTYYDRVSLPMKVWSEKFKRDLKKVNNML